jgi:hypothetical protein
MNLCKYKNIFGEPNTGAHKKRIFDIAIIDVGVTIIVAVIIYFIMIKIWPCLAGIKNLILIIVSFFILGIIIHRMFCVRTTVDKLIFD